MALAWLRGRRARRVPEPVREKHAHRKHGATYAALVRAGFPDRANSVGRSRMLAEWTWIARRSLRYAFCMSAQRLDHLKRFYELTGVLSASIGGARSSLSAPAG